MKAAFAIIVLAGFAFSCAAAEEPDLHDLQSALSHISFDDMLGPFDSQPEPPPHLQHLRFYFHARKKALHAARAFLDAGSDPNASTAYGESLLSWCAVGGRGDAISLLLDYGADPNRPSPGDRHTLPLVEAAKQAYLPANLRAMQILLTRKANPEGQDGGGRTALMAACEHGAFQGAQLLLRHGANPNTRSKLTWRYTALMFAAERGNPRSAEVVLRHGADPRLVSGESSTALSIALANRNPQTAKVIRKYLKSPNQALQRTDSAVAELAVVRRIESAHR